MSTATETRYGIAFDAAPHGMFLATVEGTIITMNRVLRTLLACDGDARLSLASLLVQPDAMRALVERLYDDGRFANADLEFVGQDGRRHRLRVSGVKLPHNGTGDCFVATATPVATPAEQAQGGESMQAFERLAATAAHDLNNVLSAMAGYCHVLHASVDDRPQARADLTSIEDAVERAGAIVRQLTALGQAQMLKPVALEPARHIEMREEALRRLLPPGVVLQITTGGTRGEVWVDPAVFDEIVMILATNARTSMPDGGVLHVRITTVERHVVLDVMDTGASRRPFAIGHDFDPFASGDSSGPYSPLALAAVRALVARSGGVVTAQAVHGLGTTFRVSFPMIDRRVHSAPEAALSPEVRRDTRGGRIFVVDDDPALRMLTERVLTLQGYEVIEARSGEEALSVIATLEQPIDLLLTDIMMPGIKGWEVGRAVRARYPTCRIIYMSGYSEARFQRELEAESQFLSKPFTPPKLTEIVGCALRAADRRVA